MPERFPAHQLRCPDCGHTQPSDLTGMLQRLHAQGQLRRDKDPSPDLVLELFRLALPQINCGSCGSVGQVLEERDEFDSEDWPEVRCCQACKQPIPAERLELYPNSHRCAACQQLEEQGGDSNNDEPEFCPHCGSLLSLRTRRSGGITRYVMYCAGCRR